MKYLSFFVSFLLFLMACGEDSIKNKRRNDGQSITVKSSDIVQNDDQTFPEETISPISNNNDSPNQISDHGSQDNGEENNEMEPALKDLLFSKIGF